MVKAPRRTVPGKHTLSGDPGKDAFLRTLLLRRDEGVDFNKYPFSIPAIRALERMDFHPQVTTAKLFFRW